MMFILLCPNRFHPVLPHCSSGARVFHIARTMTTTTPVADNGVEKQQSPTSSSLPHPFVLWGQNQTHVVLSVKLADSENVKVDIEDETISFSATGKGSHGFTEYAFQIDYYLPVVAKESRYTVNAAQVVIRLRKQLVDSWPRLAVQSSRLLPWVRRDFDLFQFSSSDSEGENDGDRCRVRFDQPTKEERERHDREMAEWADEEAWDTFVKIIKHPTTLYLLLFNIFQLAGYASVGGPVLYHALASGPSSAFTLDLFHQLIGRLVLVQLAAMLEPVHCALGWVRGKLTSCLFQLSVRTLILFCIILPHESLYDQSTTFWLFFVWSLAEIVRYPYYIFSLLGFPSPLFTYLRYTLWIFLYPVGFICEGKLTLKALPLLTESRKFCLDLPNPLNVSFSFPLFVHLCLISSLGFLYFIMRYMYNQRRRVIGPRPRCGSDQMGFFSFLPWIRSLVNGGSSRKPPSSSSNRGLLTGKKSTIQPLFNGRQSSPAVKSD